MKKLLSFFFVSILILTLTACGGPKTPKIPYEGPIENWEAVALPDDSTWVRTVISGPVENHSYNIEMNKTDFFAFLEMAMAENGWLLDKSFEAGRYFTNEAGDLISYSTNQQDPPLNVMIIIEPAGTYKSNNTEEAPLPTDSTDSLETETTIN